ncbi:uncharacterized protein LOC124622427 [Schistocerca americana]|uniref:uncharacterized protein LOC124622427 n=1 Tax=Schistocerca americana TaxID=7009 RepID=UPI001F500C26|nr:uncharacterized protein LOC124622427 [Schistocerca americana]XP_049951864.1 uncharacterized protein LOC126460208 [Schistocerca serialis cubense]
MLYRYDTSSGNPYDPHIRALTELVTLQATGCGTQLFTFPALLFPCRLQQPQPQPQPGSPPRRPPRSPDALADGGSGDDGERLVRECEQYLSSHELRARGPAADAAAPDCSRSGSASSLSESSGAAGRRASTSSLPPDDAAGLKRRRNLVGRCVNKVRSLIRK